MASLSGQADARNAFGVAGTSTTDLLQNSAGVAGAAGDADSVGAWNDRVDALGQLVGGVAVSGIVPLLKGDSVSPISFGFLAGNDPQFHQHAGVYGESDQVGVIGRGTTDGATGVQGFTKTGSGIGVRGETATGVGVQGQSFGAGLAGKFIGDVEVSGDIRVTGDVVLQNRDICELFPVSSAKEYSEGMVMVAGEDGLLAPCHEAYDERVIGVISGAGTLRSAITLGAGTGSGRTAPIALAGTAFCMVDAEHAPIQVGDMLTSSCRSGHAMKATDPMKKFGTIVGKALGSVTRVQALIPILIALR